MPIWTQLLKKWVGPDPGKLIRSIPVIIGSTDKQVKQLVVLISFQFCTRTVLRLFQACNLFPRTACVCVCVMYHSSRYSYIPTVWCSWCKSHGHWLLPLVLCRAFQFGQKKFRFDSCYRIDFFDSIRQSDKFAVCTWYSNSNLGIIFTVCIA